MANPNVKDFTAREVQAHIRSKHELYVAAVRNGIFLPQFKATVITEEYIEDCIHRRVLCPRFDEIRLKPCPSPPDK